MNEFAAELRRATTIAQLAPSSHNCQPWALCRLPTAPASDCEQLVLALDRDRALTSLDAHELEMSLSCGGYWQLLLSALATRGWEVAADESWRDVDIDLGSRWPRAWQPLACAALTPSGVADDAATEALATLAACRRTNRGPYLAMPPGASLLDELATRAGPELEARHLVGPAAIEPIARLTRSCAGRDFSHHGAWRETHSFIRWTRSAAAAGDGFTPQQLFGPLSAPRAAAMRLALAPRTLQALRLVGYPHVLAATLAAVVAAGPAFVVLSTSSTATEPADDLAAGRRLLDYWLAATASGLALHPISVLVQHADSRAAVADTLGLAGPPLFLARLGAPARLEGPALRRPAGAHVRLLESA